MSEPTPCEINGHVPFRDRRKPGSAVVCTVCKAILEEARTKPQELQSPYQPGVTVMMRAEVDDDEVRAYKAAGLVFGEGALIGPSQYVGFGDYYACEFTDQTGKSFILNLSPNMFMVVDNEKSKSILVDAMLRQ